MKNFGHKYDGTEEQEQMLNMLNIGLGAFLLYLFHKNFGRKMSGGDGTGGPNVTGGAPGADGASAPGADGASAPAADAAPGADGASAPAADSGGGSSYLLVLTVVFLPLLVACTYNLIRDKVPNWTWWLISFVLLVLLTIGTTRLGREKISKKLINENNKDGLIIFIFILFVFLLIASFFLISASQVVSSFIYVSFAVLFGVLLSLHFLRNKDIFLSEKMLEKKMSFLNLIKNIFKLPYAGTLDEKEIEKKIENNTNDERWIRLLHDKNRRHLINFVILCFMIYLARDKYFEWGMENDLSDAILLLMIGFVIFVLFIMWFTKPLNIKNQSSTREFSKLFNNDTFSASLTGQ